jgi:hypothetical protein
MTADLYDASTPSDGQTVDTPLGPVDLVAVTRRLQGESIALTYAELVYTLAVDRGGFPLGDALPSRRAAAYRRLAESLVADHSPTGELAGVAS